MATSLKEQTWQADQVSIGFHTTIAKSQSLVSSNEDETIMQLKTFKVMASSVEQTDRSQYSNFLIRFLEPRSSTDVI